MFDFITMNSPNEGGASIFYLFHFINGTNKLSLKKINQIVKYSKYNYKYKTMVKRKRPKSFEAFLLKYSIGFKIVLLTK